MSGLTPEARERLAELARAVLDSPWLVSPRHAYADAASPDVVLALLESEARLRAVERIVDKFDVEPDDAAVPVLGMIRAALERPA